ncbi:heparan-alpha-glucosaminide N-acetyltransferase domain-containing protein [Hydrocarboniphaga sp.]|uniref:heparan-alpha-glucosaminide N-acetyltransferase domain-containing protein n=1 Tax=Hydrocarboniphaga sp. TaxID=2033016 RepID=UPI003D12A9FF
MNSTPRWDDVDLLRGAIIMLMAIDHASLMVAHQHSSEFWGAALPVYDDARWLLTRLITHVCAPGFFLLMGVGIANTQRPPRYFLLRGALLILLQQVIENPAWLLASISGDAGSYLHRGGAVPGGGSPVLVHLGVLYGLGASLMLWGLLKNLPAWSIALVIAGMLACSSLTIASADPARLYGPSMRLLLVPGHSDWLQVYYPLMPWAAVSGVGLLTGRALRVAPQATRRALPWIGVLLLLTFVLLRAADSGDAHALGDGWRAWLALTKYPPGLAYLSLTTGSLLLAWSAIAALPSLVATPARVFGRSALFFYLLHLYLYAALGLLFPHGGGLALVYTSWLGGLLLLYPACRWYGAFKRNKPSDSLWRLF